MKIAKESVELRIGFRSLNKIMKIEIQSWTLHEVIKLVILLVYESVHPNIHMHSVNLFTRYETSINICFVFDPFVIHKYSIAGTELNRVNIVSVLIHTVKRALRPASTYSVANALDSWLGCVSGFIAGQVHTGNLLRRNFYQGFRLV